MAINTLKQPRLKRMKKQTNKRIEEEVETQKIK
jgi:hypothetical protein